MADPIEPKVPDTIAETEAAILGDKRVGLEGVLVEGEGEVKPEASISGDTGVSLEGVLLDDTQLPVALGADEVPVALGADEVPVPMGDGDSGVSIDGVVRETFPGEVLKEASSTVEGNSSLITDGARPADFVDDADTPAGAALGNDENVGGYGVVDPSFSGPWRPTEGIGPVESAAAEPSGVADGDSSLITDGARPADFVDDLAPTDPTALNDQNVVGVDYKPSEAFPGEVLHEDDGPSTLLDPDDMSEEPDLPEAGAFPSTGDSADPTAAEGADKAATDGAESDEFRPLDQFEDDPVDDPSADLESGGL